MGGFHFVIHPFIYFLNVLQYLCVTFIITRGTCGKHYSSLGVLPSS